MRILLLHGPISLLLLMIDMHSLQLNDAYEVFLDVVPKERSVNQGLRIFRGLPQPKADGQHIGH